MSDLSVLTTRTAIILADPDRRIWSDDAIVEAIRQILEIYTRDQPTHANVVIAGLNGTEIDVSNITGLIDVTDFWMPYTPDAEPVRPLFEFWPDSKTVHLLDTTANNDTGRVFYTAAHTIEGLDGATVTTIPTHAHSLIVTGAAALAATGRAIDVAERRGEADVLVTQQIRAWGQSQYKRFLSHLNRVQTTHPTGAQAKIATLDDYEGDWM